MMRYNTLSIRTTQVLLFFIGIHCGGAAAVLAAPASQPTSMPSTRPTAGQLGPWPRLRMGRAYFVTISQFFRLQQTVFGKDAKVIQKLRIRYKIERLQPRTKRTLRLRVTYQWISLFTHIGTYRRFYDSAHPPTIPPPRARYYAALVGQHVVLTLGPRGEVKQISETAGITRALHAALTNDPAYRFLSGSARTYMKQQIHLRFGPAQIKRQMRQLWSYLPPQPVSPGAHWTRSLVALWFTMKENATWHFVPTSAPTYQLRLKSHLHHPSSGLTPFGISATKNVRYKLSGQRTGRLFLSRQTHLPLRGEARLTLQGTLTYTPSNVSTQPKTWTLYIQTITKYSTSKRSQSTQPPQKRDK